MRMNCIEAQAELPLFVGNDLESSVHDRVAAHLESCESCRDVLLAASESRDVLVAGLQQTADLHGAFVATSSAPSVWPSLRDQLRAEGLVTATAAGDVAGAPVPPYIEGTAMGGTAPAPRGRLLHWVSSSAAAAVLLLFGAVAGQYWNGSGSDPMLQHNPSLQPGSQDTPIVAIPTGTPGTTAPATIHQPTSASLAGLTPVSNTGSSLTRLECEEDSFINNAIFYTGREVQSATPFAGSAIRMVGLRGASVPLPAPLPAPTSSPDGIR